MDIISDNAKFGKLKAYVPPNHPDSNLVLTTEEIKNCLTHWDSTVTVQDPVSKKFIPAPVKLVFSSVNVTKFRALQDWYFNNKTQSITCVTIAICPIRECDMMQVKAKPVPMFWVYMNGYKPE